MTQEGRGYLFCDECGGYYTLQLGESIDDFEKCQCGGKLEYIPNKEDIEEINRKFDEKNKNRRRTNKKESNDLDSRNNSFITTFFSIWAILLIVGLIGIIISIFLTFKRFQH